MTGLARGAAITLATRTLALLLGVVNSIILARALGPAGRGEYALIILIPAFFQFIGGFGLDHAVTFLVAKRRDDARSIALTLALATVGLGVFLVGAYAALSTLPVYLRFLDSVRVDPSLVWILIALLPITLAAQCFISALLGLERFRSYNLASLITPLTNLGLLLALVVAARLGVTGAVIAVAGANLFGCVGAGVLLLNATPAPSRPVPALIREALSYGLRVHAANVAWFLHYRSDMLLVGYLAGPAALGYYATAVALAEKLYVPPSAVGTVLLPRVAAGGPEEARRVTPVACRHTFWLTLCLGSALALLAWPLVYLLYGAEFLPAVAPLWLLLPGVVSLGVGRVLSADLNGRGLPGSVARANASMAVVNVGLNLWWIPIWGAAAAAAATSISYSLAVVLLGRRYRRETGVAWAEFLLLTRSDRAALAAALSRRLRRRGLNGSVSRESRS
jgi:O-antigen/teichoic acid export membrane protein